MIPTDCTRPFSGAPRLHSKWPSIVPSLLNKSRPTRARRTILSKAVKYRHSFSSYSNRALLLMIITLMLFVSQTLALPTEIKATEKGTSALPSKTMGSSSPTSTDLGGVESDQGGNNQGGLQDAPVVDSQSWPKPFDTSIGRNFTSTTCPAFFSVFLGDADFQACLPVSAMLKNSKGFFDITKKSGFQATLLLDAACSVDFAKCAAKMDFYAREIKLPERCGQELRDQNPLVTEAYAALIAYPSVHAATCLKAKDGSYCYVNAVTNITSPDDSHIYYLPLGFKLPGGSRPACSKCTHDTMAEYTKFAGNRSLPLFSTYMPAAEQINIVCGPRYANTSILVVSGVSSMRNTFPSFTIIIAALIPTLFLV